MPMALPNYLHVGQPKAGSTTLHFILQQNSQVCLVQSKEAHFFDTPEAYVNGLGFYQDQFFPHYDGETIVGDITPAYFQSDALERIAASLGTKVKISVCFRYPVSRSFSHYFHDIRLFHYRRSFSDALEQSRKYVAPSLGGQILQTLYRLFPKENIHVLIFERDIQGEKMHRTYPQLCRFLGIEAEPIDLLEKAGIGSLPRITTAKRPDQVDDFRGIHAVKAGDVVIETLQETRYYRADVLTDLTDEDRGKYQTHYDYISWALSEKRVSAIERRFFSEDIALLKDLLGDDIPEWDIRQLRFEAPPMLQTRLSRQADIAKRGRMGRAMKRFGKLLRRADKQVQHSLFR
jgi:hypothetical protein